MTSLEMANLICEIIDDKKGKDIVKIEVGDISSICDYFVIASGKSTTTVKAIADYIEEKLSKDEIFVKRMEGMSEGRWIAMDYGDVIVHIFNDETRLFYHLEKLWEKGKTSEFISAAVGKGTAVKTKAVKVAAKEVKKPEKKEVKKAAKTDKLKDIKDKDDKAKPVKSIKK